MDLKEFDFPKLSDVDVVFGAVNTDKTLLEEAKRRGFYGGNTRHNSLFSELFFNGGKLDFKNDLDEDFKKKVLPYLKSFMGSFSPRHEDKEAISAMLLSEIVK